VGREREMVEVKRLLSMTRLLTLTGAGGSGKTTLALEVAKDLVGTYPDGAWMVELASLSEPDLVAQEGAEALKIAERADQPLTDTLVDALGDKELLLVMDNCELATSREPLGVSGEVNRPVPLLSLPERLVRRVTTLVGRSCLRKAWRWPVRPKTPIVSRQALSPCNT
jgi:predicted ATPase